ncbi:hypothetical protein G6M16_021180 [Agrobacterium tumefaciens]|uniref:Uncharacterized protein n=1 Tax=Agrobacterium tumefaciens TaxID=358 RepID=A0A2L2LHB3_AGRTU|nr:hypothetical protein [Agrobacterium tumefaciens]AVH43699.1 hypothetical protein At1D1609_36460 [Agrobacterium tumefaciens]NSY97642.1 hypothetical protein [Agrobacterium tumefaciens]WCA61637.1 hypothetical protein G6M16_021180 [Agrobacterium tumefaciens]
MDRNPAAELVDRLIEAGCGIYALGTVGYSLADPPDDKEVSDRVHDILEDFGPRDHLFGDIIAYLNTIGRVLPLETLDADPMRPDRLH